MNAIPLRHHAEQIWRAGVNAVDSQRLVADNVRRDGTQLRIAKTGIDLRRLRRLAVVGAGKAGAGMARGFESALDPDILNRVTGWVNVPDDCVVPLQRVHLHGARPAGVNEPRPEGLAGARRILELLELLEPDDVCVVLLSGGGSALLPAPREGISLEDKTAVTRLLMSGGATIDEMNCVRRHLSEIKGGGLVCHAKSGTIVSLIVSDVVGDKLDVIASGPTVSDSTTCADAIEVLDRFGDKVPASVRSVLENEHPRAPDSQFDHVHNYVIGNNRTALDACAVTARDLGYSVIDLGSDHEGIAREVGESLAEQALDIRGTGAGPTCILSGGEPIVRLSPNPGKGGRNQEVALAALIRLEGKASSIAVLSSGTDGEDGPTDAAGGVVTEATDQSAARLGLKAREYLAANNAYPFLDATDSLLRTGPTHTNVMDIRVALVNEI